MRVGIVRVLVGLCWIGGTLLPDLAAQKVNDYILTDSSKSTSLWVMGSNNRENAQFIRVWFSYKEDPEKYYPSDIIEYGLKDGRIYATREIDLPGGKKKVFLEKRTFRDLQLLIYHYKGGYRLFLEPDSTNFFPLTEENYQSELKKWTQGAPNMEEALERTRFSKKSIINLLLFYKRGKGGILPLVHVGYSLGYSASWFGYPRRRNDIGLLAALPDFPFDFFARGEFRTNATYSGGVFAELPIGISPFSMLGGLQLRQTSFMEIRRILPNDIMYQGNFFTLELPINIRYTQLNRKWRPYGQAGLSYLRNFEGSSQFTQSRIGSIPDPEDVLNPDELIAENMYGLEAGVGLSRMLGEKNRLSLELKVKKAFGFTRSLNLEFYTVALRYSYSK